MKKSLIALLASIVVCGCSSTATKQMARVHEQTVYVEVVKVEEHLGHNINALGGHSVWCDGCRTRLTESGDPFVIYWINKQTNDTTYQFKQGQKYTVWFAGDVRTGVMGYKGKCIDLQQVVKIQEE